MSRLIVGATIALGPLLIEVEPVAHRLNLAPLHSDDWMLAVGANVLVGGALLAGELWSAHERPRRT